MNFNLWQDNLALHMQHGIVHSVQGTEHESESGDFFSSASGAPKEFEAFKDSFIESLNTLNSWGNSAWLRAWMRERHIVGPSMNLMRKG